MSNVYVALMRGINVGGKNSVPMKELVAIFEKAKCKNVETYIQSGNVVFEADDKVALTIAKTVAAGVEKRLGVKSPVVMRTASEIAAVFRGNPFLKRDAATSLEALYVMFLEDTPHKKAIASLDPNRSPPDQHVVRGREVFLHLPNGGARSKLTNAYFDSRLDTVSTARNWRTVQRLAELSAARL
jgi:uncharacterized protein (DUF1697 family)